jgi:hypothetical protein
LANWAQHKDKYTIGAIVIMIHPYSTDNYANALRHWGEAFSVPEWGCHVIVRDAGDGADAFGTYPIAAMAADADVAGGLERLRRSGLIAVTLVMDEFHRPSLAELKEHFSVVRPYKTHYIRRNALPFAYGRHHRYEVARARRKVAVRQFDLADHFPEWLALYDNLVQRHGLAGVHDFPLSHFAALQKLPGTTTIGAWLDGALVSAHIWVSDGQKVHSHLAASSGEGYTAGAAYAVYDASIRHFARSELLNFGGGAGTGNAPDDGLAIFKRDFSNESASAYICGAILDNAHYDKLVEDRRVAPQQPFFPAYRAPAS